MVLSYWTPAEVQIEILQSCTGIGNFSCIRSKIFFWMNSILDRYVNCKDMAEEACDAVRDGRLEIIPDQFEDTWFRSLSNYAFSRPYFVLNQPLRINEIDNIQVQAFLCLCFNYNSSRLWILTLGYFFIPCED